VVDGSKSGEITGILFVMFNKTFYRFLFGFIAVIAGVLVFILVIGSNVS